LGKHAPFFLLLFVVACTHSKHPVSSSAYNFSFADVEGTVPMTFFTAGTDIKPSNRRPPHNRLKLFVGLEHHETCPLVTPVSSLWNGSSRSHLEALDRCIPDQSVHDADLIQGINGLPSNLDEMDEFVGASAEDCLSAANTPPRFSSPCQSDKPSKAKSSAAFDLF
jgi:hypothetical protein